MQKERRECTSSTTRNKTLCVFSFLQVPILSLEITKVFHSETCTFIITIADQFQALSTGLMTRADDLRTWKKKQLVNHKNVVILMERGTT